MKTAILILITTFSSASEKPPQLSTVGTFYGKTYTDAATACRTWGERQIWIAPWEYKSGVFTRGFFCQMPEYVRTGGGDSK